MVIDTTNEIAIATASVIENSRNSLPRMPPINSSGRKTAINDTLIESTVKLISFAPVNAAFAGRMPSSR